jgi:hypothetical protein
MAQRVGKYKLTKREQETSLVDGGTIAGSANVTGTFEVSGDAKLRKNNVISGSSTAITVAEATHAGRTTIIPRGHTALVTHLMPAPTEGVKYHFVYVGDAVASEDIEFSADASGADFEGTIVHLHEGANDSVDVVYCKPDEDVIDLKIPQAFELTFIGKDDTTYYVWGHSTSATVPTCS